MAKAKTNTKQDKPIEITKITFGMGETRNIGNFESIRVYNELESPLVEGQKVSDVQEELRKAVIKLNERDFNSILGKV